jgi:ABC-type glycerol-3-phosphate transport system substrate-binding protein
MVGDTLYYCVYNTESSSSELYAFEIGDSDPTKITELAAMAVTGFAALDDGFGWLLTVDETMSAALIKISLGSGEAHMEIPLTASDDAIQSLAALSDGRCGIVATTKTGKNQLREIDETAQKIGGVICEFPPGLTSDGLVAGNDIIGNVYDTLVRYDIESGEQTAVLTWMDNDLNHDAVKVLSVGDDAIDCLSLTLKGASNSNASLVELRKTPKLETKEKIVLTLGCRTHRGLRDEVIAFNRENTEYRIELVEYMGGMESNEDNRQAAMLRLNTDILTGNAPDILLLDINYPIDAFLEKGLLTDLTPYMDAEYDLHPMVRRLCTRDNILFQIPAGFDVMTMVGSMDILGRSEGWTLDEAEGILANNPGYALYPEFFVRGSYLAQFFLMDLPRYYDKTTGEASFSSIGFKSAIEYAKGMPEKSVVSVIHERVNGKYLVAPLNIGSFETISEFSAIHDGALAYKGFPTASRNGSCVSFQLPLSISSTSKHKDAAWSFIKRLQTSEFQQFSTYFPSNLSNYETRSKNAMATPDPSEKVEYVYKSPYGEWNDPNLREWTPTNGPIPNKMSVYTDEQGATVSEVPLFPLTQAQLDDFNGFLATIDRVDSYDVIVEGIVYEEIAPYLAGQKNLDEVCVSIQKRVEIYLNEQL